MSYVNCILKFNNTIIKKNTYKLCDIFSVKLEKIKLNKSVKFKNENEIYYIDNEKYKELFYNSNDYENFRLSAKNDICYVMSIRHVNFEDAKNILYHSV